MLQESPPHLPAVILPGQVSSPLCSHSDLSKENHIISYLCSKTFQRSHYIQNRNKTPCHWSLLVPLILPTICPHLTELAFCYSSNTNAFFPPQGLCICWTPACHAVPPIHAHTHIKPHWKGHSTSLSLLLLAMYPPLSAGIFVFLELDIIWYTTYFLFAYLFGFSLSVSPTRLQAP